jgi:hypothetical protein
MYTLIDCWWEKYFHDDGSVNEKCLYFLGVSEYNKMRILNEYFNKK